MKPNKIPSGQIIPVRRKLQKHTKHASERNSIPMCEIINRKERIIRFPDEAIFIQAVRLLNKKMDMEFYQED